MHPLAEFLLSSKPEAGISCLFLATENVVNAEQNWPEYLRKNIVGRAEKTLAKSVTVE